MRILGFGCRLWAELLSGQESTEDEKGNHGAAEALRTAMNFLSGNEVNEEKSVARIGTNQGFGAWFRGSSQLNKQIALQ
jgi:hypothetical protein